MTREYRIEREGLKIPKGYHASSQGWPAREDAVKAAKNMRKIGYRARVIHHGNYHKVLWAAPEDLRKR